MTAMFLSSGETDGMSVYPEKCASSSQKDEEQDCNYRTNYGIIGLVRSAAKEVGEREIRVNAVTP